MIIQLEMFIKAIWTLELEDRCKVWPADVDVGIVPLKLVIKAMKGNKILGNTELGRGIRFASKGISKNGQQKQGNTLPIQCQVNTRRTLISRQRPANSKAFSHLLYHGLNAKHWGLPLNVTNPRALWRGISQSGVGRTGWFEKKKCRLPLINNL